MSKIQSGFGYKKRIKYGSLHWNLRIRKLEFILIPSRI